MKSKLKKDLIIKAGAEFECIDGETKEFVNGNYSYLFSLGKDDCGELIIDENMINDFPEYFEKIEE